MTTSRQQLEAIKGFLETKLAEMPATPIVEADPAGLVAYELCGALVGAVQALCDIVGQHVDNPMGHVFPIATGPISPVTP